MIGFWLMLSVAFGATCPDSFEARVAELLQEGIKEHYVCVVDAEDAERQLVAAMGQTWQDSAAPLRRAMVFVLLNTLERPWNPKHVLLLSPADRRLLADGVKARRGRKSPSLEHDQIFRQWDWYRPIPSYTDNRLSQIDVINVGMADNPNEFVPRQPLVHESSSRCGCDHSTVVGWIWMIMLWVLIGNRRRNGV